MVIDEGLSPAPARTRSEYELGAIGLVDKTISLWGRKLPQFIVMVGLTGVVVTIFQTIVLLALFGIIGFTLIEFLGSSPIDVVFSLILGSASPMYMIILLFLSVIGFLVYAVVAGGAIHYSLCEYENPGSGYIRESFSFATGKLGSLIGVQLILSFIIGGLGVLAAVILFIDYLVSLAMTFLILYVAVRLAPALAIVIAEGRPAMESVSRAWQITGGLFWHVFVAQIIIGIVVLVIDFAVAFGITMFFVIAIPDYTTILLLTSLVSTLLVSSINYIYLAVLYRDLEARGTSGEYDWWQ